MVSQTVGSLAVEAQVGSKWLSTSFSKKGQQHSKISDLWSGASLTLPKDTAHVRFVAKAGVGYGDISVDSIEFIDQAGRGAPENGFSITVGGGNTDWMELNSITWQFNTPTGNKILKGRGADTKSTCKPPDVDCIG